MVPATLGLREEEETHVEDLILVANQVESPAIARILDEVLSADACECSYGPYDRVHNKHNR